MGADGSDFGNDFRYRHVVFFGSHFQEFFAQQADSMRAKMVWTFQLIEEIDRVPETYLKHLTGTPGLYEIRVQYGNDVVRIFCFFASGSTLVILNAFRKTTRKTPRKELNRALLIKHLYETLN